MAVYEYRCRECQFEALDTRPDRDPLPDLGECPWCADGVLKRVWTLQIAPVMQEHYNSSVGKPVSSMRAYKDDLKRASDAATERTGIPHNFVPVGGSDEAKALSGIDTKTIKDDIRLARERNRVWPKPPKSTAPAVSEWANSDAKGLKNVRGESARKARGRVAKA